MVSVHAVLLDATCVCIFPAPIHTFFSCPCSPRRMATDGGVASLRADFQLVQQQLLLLTQEIRAIAASNPSSVVTSTSDEQVKRARLVDSSGIRSPLDKDELLDTVFSYVGDGDYFFAAGVCRRWRGRYIKLCYYKAIAADHIDKLRTTFSSAFMTAARLQLALKSGLQVEKLHDYEDLANDIAKHSLEPIEALTVAKTYDMRYPGDMANDAAYYGRLQLLQWLHERRNAWSDADVLDWAARGGSLDVLIWLQSVTAPWTDAKKVHMMQCAADHGRVDGAKWLREIAGAPWHSACYAAKLYRSSVQGYRNLTFSKWLLARADCCWDGWDCKVLVAERHRSDSYKQRAAELFTFAHQHGCPCTCEAAV
jgi:hypothetical protein